MKILGWILTIVGGFLSFGALIQITDQKHSGTFVPEAALTAIVVFVAGLVILNRQKKN